VDHRWEAVRGPRADVDSALQGQDLERGALAARCSLAVPPLLWCGLNMPCAPKIGRQENDMLRCQRTTAHWPCKNGLGACCCLGTRPFVLSPYSSKRNPCARALCGICTHNGTDGCVARNVWLSRIANPPVNGDASFCATAPFVRNVCQAKDSSIQHRASNDHVRTVHSLPIFAEWVVALTQDLVGIDDGL
jgi:hypothetical protein